LVKRYERGYGDTRNNGFLALRLSRSFKVIGTGTDRSGTYDFLLTFHGPISYLSRAVSEINSDIGREKTGKKLLLNFGVFENPKQGLWGKIYITSSSSEASVNNG